MKPKEIDPVKFIELCWPHVKLYDKQAEILYSLRDNDETIVPAGNQLGKDFVSALAVLWFFCTRRPAKVVTTSVKQSQLTDVLWGEIRKFLEQSKVKLPITSQHLRLRQLREDGSMVPNAECVGEVVNQGESLLGRHLPRGDFGQPRTLVVFDEASGIDDGVYNSTDTWAHRKLIIGNPFPCTNFFYTGVKAGDLKRTSGIGYFRKIIKIKATDSPNVELGLTEIAAGRKPSYKQVLEGVKDFSTYEKHRALWDKVRQCISLDAEFYEGHEVMMFPPDWLNKCEATARALKGTPRRAGMTMGVDTAQGGDNSCWTIGDDLGIIHQLVQRTPDTAVIPGITISLMKEYGVRPENVMFDAGGGGKEHADRLRQMGYRVRSVGFGEPASMDKYTRRVKTKKERVNESEYRYIYKNKRAEMYGLLRLRMNPNPEVNETPFALPDNLVELRRQLSLIPLVYDPEGRMILPPKSKRNPDSKERTLIEIIGNSPDEADSTVLMNYAQFTFKKTLTFTV